MNLRRKVYTWYAITMIASMIFIYALKVPVTLSTLVFVYMAVLLSVLPVVLFLEYGIFLRIKRVHRTVKRPTDDVKKDYGHDELSEIADFVNEIIKEKFNLSEQLQTSKARVENVLDDAPVLIQRFDKDGNMIYINNTYANHFEIFNREEFVKTQNIFEFLVSKGYDFDLKKDLSALTARNPRSENIYKRRTERGYMMWVNKAVFDEFGNIIEYQTIGIDITKAKEFEERLKLLAESISTIVIWLDTDLSIKYSSDSAAILHPMLRFQEHMDTQKLLSEIKIGNENLLEVAVRCSSTKERFETTQLIKNTGRASKWYSLTVKYLESGIMILLDDINEVITAKVKLEKTEKMRGFAFNLINELTSCDLKDIKKVVTAFSPVLGKFLYADIVIIGLYENKGLRIVSKWDIINDPNLLTNNPSVLASSEWWNFKFDKYSDKDFLINNVLDTEDANVRKMLSANHIQSFIVAPVSFNHTNIGVIFAASRNHPFCDIDTQTVKLSGRLIGMTLRPTVIKSKDGVKTDRRVI